MYLVRTPQYIQNIFTDFTWRFSSKSKKLYLTFDDGPIPETTLQILKVLRRYNALATFFCVGENIRKHPDLFNKIIDDGHSVGSHTYNHISGWTTRKENYVKNVKKGADISYSSLFRPPYGRIRPSQVKEIKKKYQIIMWDVLSGDFDENVDPETCFNNVLENTEAGSIIVFHDSIKAKAKVDYALPLVLEHYANQGFTFEKIETEKLLKFR